MNCVCNNLLWDACLRCKHWRPQVVVNGRKILRMWQKGSMLNMPNAENQGCFIFSLSSARLRRIVQPFALSSTISPLRCTLALAQPLCQGLSTGVDNGGDEDEDIYSSETLHSGLKTMAIELVMQREQSTGVADEAKGSRA